MQVLPSGASISNNTNYLIYGDKMSTQFKYSVFQILLLHSSIQHFSLI